MDKESKIVMHSFLEHIEERFGLYEGIHVPLEQPMIEISEEPELNKPKRSSGKKKYVVYVKNPKTGNVKKIEFGDEKGGLSAKISDREAARNLRQDTIAILKQINSLQGTGHVDCQSTQKN